VIYVLTLFIVIALSRPVNKNVSAGAVMKAKPGTEPGIHKLYWQTIRPDSVTQAYEWLVYAIGFF